MNYKNFQKKKNKKFIFGMALVAAVLVIALSAFFVSKAFGDNKGYRTISVIEVSGAVTVVKDGIEYSAYPGMHLQEGHVLITGGDSLARLVLDGDKYVKVESGSRVVFETLGFLGSGKTAIGLERGAITSELVKPLGEDQEFVINTPNAVLAVRGTFFRVDLRVHGKGELRANVMTYGGQVATRRVFPSGEVEEEEVLVDAGYKTAIHMDEADTVYVVEEVAGAKDTTGDDKIDIEPIDKKDISDADMVDIYYSAENGHALFVTAVEAKADIDARNIDLENTVSVYQKAAEVVAAEEAGGETDAISGEMSAGLTTVIDDSKPLLAEAETDQKEEPNASPDQSVVSGGDGENTSPENDAGENETAENNTAGDTEDGNAEDGTNEDETNGDGEEQEETVTGHVHTETETIIEPTCLESGSITVSCEDCGEILSEEELPATGHTIVIEQSGATCEHTGWKKEVCSVCNEQISYTNLPVTDHAAEYVGTEFIHSRCAYCGITLSTAHEITDRVTREATCTEEGIRLYSCACGYSYEVPIDATGHTSVYGGTADVHRKCDTCGEVLEDGSAHELAEIGGSAATCTATGLRNQECPCGYSEQEVIPMLYHQYEESTNTCSSCGLPMVAINSVNFPDTLFRSYVESFDTNIDGYLYSTELVKVTSLDVSGTEWSGGGYTSLQGISYFTQLKSLSCSYNESLDALDLSLNMNLQTLNVTGCTGLTSLNVSNTKLVELNVSDLDNLVSLTAANCSELYLVAGDSCDSLTDVVASGCGKLYSASFEHSTALRTVDVSNAVEMYMLNLNSCTALETVNVTNCGSLTGNFFINAYDTGKTVSILTGFASHMSFQAQ